MSHMIHFVTGKPGGGKTLFSVRLMVDELVKGKRTVVTNLPLNMANLNGYIQKKYPQASVNLFQRIRLLDEDQTKKFYMHRGYDLEGVVVDIPESELPLDYSAGAVFGPVLYIVDEIHLYFNAREFAKTGKAALWYVSQHRKLGDDVVCVTQFVGNVDKQFRVLAQDFTAIRNLANEKLGFFNLPGIFTRRTFQDIPTPTSTPCETGTFKLDVEGIASCYETAKGVGIMGVGDTARRKKGLNWKYSLVAVIMVCCVMMFLPKILGSLIQKGLGAAMGSAGSVSKELLHNGITNESDTINEKITNSIKQADSSSVKRSYIENNQEIDKQKKELYIIGFTQVSNKCKLYLSDGRVIPTQQVKDIIGKVVEFKDGTKAIYDECYKPDPVRDVPTVFVVPKRITR